MRWQRLGWALALAMGCGEASAQAATWSWNLRLTEPDPTTQALPVFASGQAIEGQADESMTLTGDAQVRQSGLVVRADRLHHDSAAQSLDAQGDVRVLDQGNRYRGEALHLKLDSHEGRFSQPKFELDNGGRGDAASVLFLGPKRSTASEVRYSTCPMPAEGEWMPDWVLSASTVSFDREANVGTAWGSVVRFKGVPVMASPWMRFPLNDERQSGFLPLGVNISDTSGLELVLPYYLNLAPNYDATVVPQLLSKRGVNWGGELRYLFDDWRGQLRADWMSHDSLRPGDSRYALSWQHRHALNWAGQPVGLDINVNRVSDDNYWRDFPRSLSALTQRQLPTDVVLSTHGRRWSLSAGSYQWQTLQQPDAIVAAYDRVPQVRWDWQLPKSAAVGLRLSSELTRFEVDRSDAENGWRWLGSAEIGRRWAWGPGHVEPALRVQARHYNTDQAMARDGHWQGGTSASVLVPTGSVGAGLAFERDLDGGGLQTLEPRVLLAYTPTQTQRGLPLYDAAAKDFNLASVFSPFEYSGHDRVADNQSLTWGLTSRWLRADGGEWLSLSWAQKQRFSPQQVTLDDGEALPAGASDWLLAGSWRYDAHWRASATAQYDRDIDRVRRSTAALVHQQGPFRQVRLGYTFQRDASELLDLTWQWPLNDLWGDRGRLAAGGGNLGAPRWYGVGRLNYSLRERKLVDAIVGLEYDAGCWMSRLALERIQNSSSSASHRLFLQLELTGLGRLGSSPLQSLQDNVPHYQVLRREFVAPSRYENYE